jgi:hypothetical protein
VRLNLVRYTLLSSLWLAIAYLMSQSAVSLTLFYISFGGAALAVPILAIGLYSSTVSKILRAQAYRSGGWLLRFATARVLSTIYWSVFSLFVGFCAVFWFSHLSVYEWALIVISIPFFRLIQQGVFRILSSQYKGYVAVDRSLRAARWIYAVVFASIFLCMGSLIDESPQPKMLTEIMQAHHEAGVDMSKSVLIQYANRYSEYYHQVKLVAFSEISAGDMPWPLMVYLLSSIGVFYSVSAAFSAFALPASEFRRIALPIADTETTDEVPVPQIIFASALVTVVLLFIYIPGLATLEVKLRTNPNIRAQIADAERVALPVFEHIEGRFFRRGTIDEVQELQVALVASSESRLQEIVLLADLGYERMKFNVDGYLDQYYSLPAEYLRIAALMTGSLEQKIADDLTESLVQENPFGDMERTVNRLVLENLELKVDFEQSVAQIMRDNEVNPVIPNFKIARSVSMSEVMSPVAKMDLIDVRLRAAGAGVGAMTGLVAAKVVGKAMAKGTVKLAAKALSKVAMSKGASAAAGGGAGAAIGSFFPGIGTAVGAVIGTTVGMAVGVSVDFMLIKLEETLSREDFKRGIIASIEEAKFEFYKTLLVPSP